MSRRRARRARSSTTSRSGYTGPFDADRARPRRRRRSNAVPSSTIPPTTSTSRSRPGVGIDVVHDHRRRPAPGTCGRRCSTRQTDGEDDLDLYLFDPDGNFVDGSGIVTSAEQVDAPSPVEGDWTLVVHGWETDGPDAIYDLFTWIVGDADAGNLTVSAPASADHRTRRVPSRSTWAGLTAATRYLGSVSYSDGTNDIGQTLVAIKT